MNLKNLPKKYLIPNIFTAMNLIFGYLSFCVEPTTGIYLVFLAAILDGLDGYTARLLQAQSSFGEQFDSLSDFLSFGVAPAFLFSRYINTPWFNVLSMIYVLAVAIRLARFNVVKTDKSIFQGLPSPAAAVMLMSLILFHEEVALKYFQIVSPVFILLLSFLMMSSLKFPALFKGYFKNKVLVIALITISLISLFLGGIYPFLLMMTYLLYSLLYGLKNYL